MSENQHKKNLKYVHPFNCLTSQFNTIKLSEKSKVNKCPHCLKTFIKPSGLKAHIFSHTGEKPHKCPVTNCGRYFSLLSNLRRHIKIHNKENTKNRLSTSKRSVPKIRPLLPVGPSLTNQHDGGNQMDQEQCQMSHGTAPSHDAAYFHRGSSTSVEYHSLPVTPMGGEDVVFANGDYNGDKKIDVPSSLMNSDPITNLMAPSLYLQSNDFQLPTTQVNLEDALHIQTPTMSVFPADLEHPPWSTVLSSEAQLSIEELNCLENYNNQYLALEKFFYPQDFFPERIFFLNNE